MYVLYPILMVEILAISLGLNLVHDWDPEILWNAVISSVGSENHFMNEWRVLQEKVSKVEQRLR